MISGLLWKSRNLSVLVKLHSSSAEHQSQFQGLRCTACESLTPIRPSEEVHRPIGVLSRIEIVLYRCWILWVHSRECSFLECMGPVELIKHIWAAFPIRPLELEYAAFQSA